MKKDGFFNLFDSPFSQPIIGIGIALLLLLPLIFFAVDSRLLPANRLYQTAQTSEDLLRDSEPVGNENYEHMYEDERYQSSVEYT